MNAGNVAKLAAIVAKQGGAVMADALGDIRGQSLTYDPAKFLTVDNLNQEINQHACMPLAGPAVIESLQIQNIPSVSSNCVNHVISIEQEGEKVLPDSLFVKLPMASAATRWFMNITGSWQLESYVCRHVAPQLPLRTPHTYATYCQGTRFYLVQENLHGDPSVQLFTNPDMADNVSVELAMRCVDAFAKLHSHHYHLSASDREAVLPLDHHPFKGRNMRYVSRALNSMALKPCIKKLPGHIPENVVAAYQKTLQNWDSLAQFWFSGPLSLVHGDSHIGNFFVDGDEMGMLDFQATHWGKGIRDVVYFLVDSLPADVLAQNEQDFVKYYVEQRAAYGAAVDFEQTWQEYRSFTYHSLMTIVVSIGFGALNEEQDELMIEMLARAVAAAERVDYAGWLDDFVSKT